jgi:ribonuclease VapC
MIVDTSALIAILRDEPEAVSFARAIENSAVRRLSAANFVEATVIIDASRDPIASRRFDDLIKEAQIIIEPVTEPQARNAREAYRDFGKGSSHPAQLNLGDCFAYALAKSTGEPLLFKGDVFTHTDIQPAGAVGLELGEHKTSDEGKAVGGELGERKTSDDGNWVMNLFTRGQPNN